MENKGNPFVQGELFLHSDEKGQLDGCDIEEQFEYKREVIFVRRFL